MKENAEIIKTYESKKNSILIHKDVALQKLNSLLTNYINY